MPRSPMPTDRRVSVLSARHTPPPPTPHARPPPPSPVLSFAIIIPSPLHPGGRERKDRPLPFLLCSGPTPAPSLRRRGSFLRSLFGSRAPASILYPLPDISPSIPKLHPDLSNPPGSFQIRCRLARCAGHHIRLRLDYLFSF